MTESEVRKLPAEMKEALMQAFDDIDIDKSGSISRKELRAALQLIGQNPTNAEMLKFMPDDSGEFDRESFVKFVEENVHIQSPEEIDKELMAAFEKFDTNKNFLISKEEFRHIMTSDNMGDEPLTEEEADELLGNLDVDGDGQLNIIDNNYRNLQSCSAQILHIADMATSVVKAVIDVIYKKTHSSLALKCSRNE